MPKISKTWALSIGTSPTKIPANPKRDRLLIQNLSANILYRCYSSNGDVAQCIKIIDGYETEAQDDIYLIASAATSDVRLEEIVDA